MNRGRYTVNEVEYRTKVPASTLRQWERRYGFPKPERSGSGYRLYGEGDVRSIELMKQYIAEGVSASRAAELVGRAETQAPPGSLDALQAALLDAFLNLDEAKAEQVFSQAHSFHSVETVFSELVQRTMVKLGLLWHRGEIPITTEHFASAYIYGRLRTLMSATANPGGGARVIVACAPLEHHELGALVLATLLRRAGYHVLYVGADTPVADLREMARDAQPSGVLISASVGGVGGAPQRRAPSPRRDGPRCWRSGARPLTVIPNSPRTCTGFFWLPTRAARFGVLASLSSKGASYMLDGRFGLTGPTTRLEGVMRSGFEWATTM